VAADDERRKTAFKRRVRHWAYKLDVSVVWLGVRSMNSKWASCSTKGHLNFNADLLAHDEAVWDYVIVHELLHFFVPNHGKLWKSLMRAHLGDYERAMERLSAPPIKAARRTTRHESESRAGQRRRG
jgi:predicted metal-dependent hydrolase